MDGAFARQGFAVAPPLPCEALLAACRAAVERIQAGLGAIPEAVRRERLVLERDLPAKQRDGRPAAEAGDALFIIGDAPAFDPVFAELAIQPALVAEIRRLLGTDDIRLQMSNVTLKQPGIGSRIAWHRDYPNRYICPGGPTFLRAMLCLDGMDRENGGTAFLPGAADVPEGFVEGAVFPAVAPGGAVFIHPGVLHGSPPNASPRPRRNLIVQWGRADDPPLLHAGQAESLTGFSVGEIEDWVAGADRD